MGQAMVRHFTTWSRSHAAAAISVTAYATNRSARAFYDKLGFIEQSVVLRAALDQ
jgi:ribosomal protein S18 acetylase RimI-like enzyme